LGASFFRWFWYAGHSDSVVSPVRPPNISKWLVEMGVKRMSKP
jgi:hypothetical protein